MARLLGTRAQDWPEAAGSPEQARRAVRHELSRLCKRADALSVAAYGDYLAHAVAAWERSNVPIQGRGLMFGSRKKELRELCNEARARLAAACGEGSPYMGPALAFVSRLEACGFDSCAEMESAFECAVEDTNRAVLAPRDHEEV